MSARKPKPAAPAALAPEVEVEPQPQVESRQGLTGVDDRLVDPPEEHTNFAPDTFAVEYGEGWPIGVAAPGVAEGDTTWKNGVEYVVGADGCISHPA